MFMDSKTSPVFSSFWSRVYSSASRHLFGLGVERKTREMFQLTCVSQWERACQVEALLLTKGLAGQEEQKEERCSLWSHGSAELPVWRRTRSYRVWFQSVFRRDVSPPLPPPLSLLPHPSCNWTTLVSEEALPLRVSEEQRIPGYRLCPPSCGSLCVLWRTTCCEKQVWWHTRSTAEHCLSFFHSAADEGT